MTNFTNIGKLIDYTDEEILDEYNLRTSRIADLFSHMNDELKHFKEVFQEYERRMGGLIEYHYLSEKIDTALSLDPRSSQMLKNDRIIYLGDLLTKSENDLLKIPNLGLKSVKNIKEALMVHGLRLNMGVLEWRRPND